MDKEIILEEYKMLRKEIDDKIKITNNITLQMIGSFLVLAGIGFEKKCTGVLPLCSMLCLFMYLRIFYYHQSIARISAYLIVFIEKNIDIKWETSNHLIFQDVFRNCLSKTNICKMGWMSFIECFTFQIISLGLWIILSNANHIFNEIERALLATCILFSIVLVFFDRHYHNGQKGNWIQHWKDFNKNKYKIDTYGLTWKK